jgi:predicted nucleic acid-binding Zn ribbon protein
MKCEYRNCSVEVTGRPNKKFCSIKCKRNEAKYRKRIKEKIIKSYENNEH